MTKLISNNNLAQFTDRNIDRPPEINPNENRNNNGLLKTALIGGGITAGALIGRKYLKGLNKANKNIGNAVKNKQQYNQSQLPSSNDVTKMQQEKLSLGVEGNTEKVNIPEPFRAKEAEVGIRGANSDEFLTRKSKQGRNNGVVEMKKQQNYGKYKKPNPMKKRGEYLIEKSKNASINMMDDIKWRIDRNNVRKM